METKIDFMNTSQFDALQRVCKFLIYSDIVPSMYRKTSENPENKAIANCMIALEMSNRLGESVLSIMQNLYIVNGKPALSAKFLIGVINSCGKFNQLQFKIYNKGILQGRHDIEGNDLQNLCCVAFTQRVGSEIDLVSTEVSLSVAIKEGWYDRKGSKWVTFPEQMIKYRAASFWINIYAPELTIGLRTAEEEADITNTCFDVEDKSSIKENIVIDIENIEVSSVDNIDIEIKKLELKKDLENIKENVEYISEGEDVFRLT